MERTITNRSAIPRMLGAKLGHGVVPTAISAGRLRVTVGPVAVGSLGCLLALIVGATMATGQALPVAGVLVGLAFCTVAVVFYAKDPVLALIWLWVIVVFNAPLSAAVGEASSTGQAIRQTDEVLVLLFLALTVWRTTRVNARMPSLRFMLPGIGIALFGFVSGILQHVPIEVTIVGAWLGLKLWIMVGITLLLPWKPGDPARVYSVLTKAGLFLAALGLADYSTHGAVSRVLHTSPIRFSTEGFRGESVHSIFPQPGEFSMLMSLLFALTFARFSTARSKSDLVLALIFAASVMLSLRLKGFLSLGAIVGIVALVHAITANRGAATILFVGTLLFVSVYSLDGSVIAKQISTYASSETTTRARLYATGERIASEDFPLGAGFGRFASYPSRLYYSPVYYQYELSSVYGLSRAYPDFIDDTSWPCVIGETGYGGGLIYLCGLIFVVFTIIKRLRTAAQNARWVPLAALCGVAAILIDSLGAPTLFDWIATTTIALMIGPAMMTARSVTEDHAYTPTADEP